MAATIPVEPADDRLPPNQCDEALTIGSARGRWTILAAVLGSGMALLDTTVVNVALPHIGRDLGADLTGLQWVVGGYALTLAALLLVGGGLGDRYGRRRIYRIGVAWFALASAGCALAPTPGVLIVARAVQGVGAALLTPGSLAILQASFAPDQRSRAIGAWTGLTGFGAALGPFLGGWIVDIASWRWIFLINLPLAAVVLLTARHAPESRDPTADGPVDAPGGLLAALALGGLSYALIDGPQRGFGTATVLAALLVGIAAGIAFVVVEQRRAHPMLPLTIFSSAPFSVTNVVTFAMYGALGGALFLLPVTLQTVVGYSAPAAGTATLPITIIMLVLSPASGALAARIGPRLQMSVGPLVVAAGMLALRRVGPHSHYLPDILPAVVLVGLGLSIAVAPLTAAALAAAPEGHTGLASGVNNAVARTAGLLAVAVLPGAAGIGGDDYAVPAALHAGFATAVLICAGLAVAAGLIAGAGLRVPASRHRYSPVPSSLSRSAATAWRSRSRSST